MCIHLSSSQTLYRVGPIQDHWAHMPQTHIQAQLDLNFRTQICRSAFQWEFRFFNQFKKRLLLINNSSRTCLRVWQLYTTDENKCPRTLDPTYTIT